MTKLYNDRAITYVVKKDYPNALADFNRAIAQAPNNPDFLFRRSIVHCRMGSKELAEADEKKLTDGGLELPSTCKSRTAGTN